MRLIYIALGWVAGIALAANNTSGSPVIAAIWLGLAGLAFVAAWISRADPTLRWPLIALVAFTLGGLRFALAPVSSDIARFNNAGGLTITGLVAGEPIARDDRLLLRIETQTVTRAGRTEPSAGLVLVQAPPLAVVRYGDRVNATGNLVVPAEFDTFSYADYLARGGVYSVMPNAAIEVLESEQGSPFYSAILEIKRRAADAIAVSLPEPQAALLTGILLGDESGIAPQMRDDFAAVGASHVVAISGFNMAILSGVLMGILRRARIGGFWAAGLGIGVIAVYMVLVGANAAVVRAALMSAVLIIGEALRRRAYVPTSLAFVALVLSLINPTVLWDVSFQLSFFATLGLALYADSIGVWLNRGLERLFAHRTATAVSGFLAEPLVVTLAVQVTTLPLIILYFGRFSPLLVPVNLLIVPVQAPLLLVGAAATLTTPVIPLLGQVLYWYDLVFLGWTTGVVQAFAALPFADAAFTADPRVVTFYFFVLTGVALMQAAQPDWAVHVARFVRSRAVASAGAVAGFSTLVLIVALLFSRPDGVLHVWFLDMGHSNAVLIQTPGGAHMLVDGGRFPSRLLTAIGERLPFNDRTIEVLFLTQPDEADYAALPAVFGRYDAGVVVSTGQPNLSEPFAVLQEALRSFPQVNAHAGYKLALDDGVLVEVLHPQRQPTLSDSLNDSTLVLRLRYGDVSFLLTGDLSEEGQAALMVAGQWPLATVLQLPRHGSVRSLDEAFLDAVQPQVTVVQSDRANRLGDPDADTLALLGDLPLLRTDLTGTIHLWTDGKTLWMQ